MGHLLGEERCRKHPQEATQVLGRSIGREIGQVNISTEHLIECLDVLGDESRPVEYSGVSGILYWLLYVWTRLYYAVILYFSARCVTLKVGEMFLEAK